MSVFSETIDLKDNVSDAAKKAADQMDILQSAVTATENALLKAQATGNVKKYQSMSKDLAALKASMSLIEPEANKYTNAQEEMTKAEKARTDSLAETKKKQDEFKEATKNAAADAAHAMEIGKEVIGGAITGIKNAFSSLASGDVQGAVAGLTESVASMAKMLDLVVPGLGQVVSTVVTIAGGLVGITAGLIQAGAAFAIESNQAKQAMLGMFDAMGGKGAEIDDMLSGLADKIGISKDELAPMTKAFLSMGITGTEALEKITTAAISANAIMGDPAAGKAFESLTQKIQIAAQTGQGLKIPLKGLGSLADMGLTVDDVAKKMGVSTKKLSEDLKNGSANAEQFGMALQDALIEKGAGPLQRMGQSFENIKKKFMQDWGDIFEDIDVSSFMGEVKELFNIFGQAQPSGQALKAGIGGFFKEFFATATKVVPYVKHFMLDLVIYGLKAYIAVKPIISAFKEWATSESGMESIKSVLSAIGEVLMVVGVSVGVVIGLYLILAGAVVAVSVAFWAAVGAIIGFVDEAGGVLTEWVGGAATAAFDFVAGLVNGLASGASQVVGAVTGLADQAIDAFDEALGINSPSTVMRARGEFAGEGAVEGLDNSKGDVAAAAQGLANSASDGFNPSAPASGSKSGGSGLSVVFEAGAFTIDGAGKSAMEITEEMVSLVFERIALAQGIS